MKTMKGLAFLGPCKVGMVERAVPEAGPNDAIIKTTASFICTSDVHTVESGYLIPDGRIIGHESVGIVYQVGSNVTMFKAGDRVAVCATTACGKCANCQRGLTAHCEMMFGGFKFVNQKDGNLAEYFHVNDADFNLVRIPEGITDEQALYATDMLPTGFAAVENAQVPLGGTVAIFAQGPVGLCATIGARLLGAGLIIAVESNPQRGELAKRYGADIVVNPAIDDPVDQIFELTNNLGVDAAIEAVGLPETFENCIKVTKPGGIISNVGYHEQPLEIPLFEFGLGMGNKQIRTAFCPSGSERISRILRLIETGRVDPTPMTSHRFPFSEVETAYRMFKNKADNIIKPLIYY